MKNLLLGNGINIQFGGVAYSSSFIMKRIKYQAKLDRYDELFGNKLTGTEIVNLLENFVEEANNIREGVFCKRNFLTFAKIFPQAPVGKFYVNPSNFSSKISYV